MMIEMTIREGFKYLICPRKRFSQKNSGIFLTEKNQNWLIQNWMEKVDGRADSGFLGFLNPSLYEFCPTMQNIPVHFRLLYLFSIKSLLFEYFFCVFRSMCWRPICDGSPRYPGKPSHITPQYWVQNMHPPAKHAHCALHSGESKTCTVEKSQPSAKQAHWRTGKHAHPWKTWQTTWKNFRLRLLKLFVWFQFLVWIGKWYSAIDHHGVAMKKV